MRATGYRPYGLTGITGLTGHTGERLAMIQLRMNSRRRGRDYGDYDDYDEVEDDTWTRSHQQVATHGFFPIASDKLFKRYQRAKIPKITQFFIGILYITVIFLRDHVIRKM